MGGLRRVAKYVDAITETWIGWHAPPVHRALEDASWAPDPRDAYCHRCGDTIGPGEANKSGCASCRDQPRIGDAVVRLGRYATDLRSWILGVKYAQWAAMGDELGRQLGDAVKQAEVVAVQDAVVTPMPMPWQRRLYRGIDHAGVIAAGVARSLQVPMVRCLVKSNGPPMVSLTATERAVVGGRGMRVKHRWGGWPLHDMDVILVDDVRTTGASIRGAVRILRSLHVRKVAVALVAVAEDADRRPQAEIAHSRDRGDFGREAIIKGDFDESSSE